jgi:hypothetical protein
MHLCGALLALIARNAWTLCSFDVQLANMLKSVCRAFVSATCMLTTSINTILALHCVLMVSAVMVRRLS